MALVKVTYFWFLVASFWFVVTDLQLLIAWYLNQKPATENQVLVLSHRHEAHQVLVVFVLAEEFGGVPGGFGRVVEQGGIYE